MKQEGVKKHSDRSGFRAGGLGGEEGGRMKGEEEEVKDKEEEMKR